jgi:putative MATE family efflux protein
VQVNEYMQLTTTYRQILNISFPIMVGSAAQNVITLTDGIFLGRYGEIELGAIGIAGVFYLIIAAIGYSFSKGGQIMIARRMGQGRPTEVGHIAHAMLVFTTALATIMFFVLQYGVPLFFPFFIQSELVFERSLEYLYYRSFGVYFSYIGVALIALYTGISRTSFIIYTTVILGLVNVILNYGLIFGDFGLPEMGMAGAGLASTIAEATAFVAFVIYMIRDKKNRILNLFSWPKVDIPNIVAQIKIALPVVAQSIVGLGSAFLFFSFIENLGEQSLAITNLVRMVYLCFSVPIWGLCSGIHTMVSHYIGSRKRMGVLPIIKKTAMLSLFITVIITIPAILFPRLVLSIGTDDPFLIEGAVPVLYVLIGILYSFSVSSIFFNGLIGTGATYGGLKIQFWSVSAYLILVYVLVEHFNAGLQLAWAAEIFYWVLIIFPSWYYLRAKGWHRVNV